jgi:serine/threonine protein kinase
MPFKPGTKPGPYEIMSAIDAAKAGNLYKASDTRLKRTVAIKVFDSQFSDSFVREAHAIGSINHLNICALHDVGHEENVDFLVMEYLRIVEISCHFGRKSSHLAAALVSDRGDM